MFCKMFVSVDKLGAVRMPHAKQLGSTLFCMNAWQIVVIFIISLFDISFLGYDSPEKARLLAVYGAVCLQEQRSWILCFLVFLISRVLHIVLACVTCRCTSIGYP